MYQSNHKEPNLLKAIKLGFIERVKSLLWQGAEVNIKDKNGDTPLILAIESEPIVAQAQSYSSDYNMRRACYDGKIEMVKLLVKEGANIETKSKYGNTPLICAAHHGETEVVRFLLEQGADIKAVGRHGNTALLSAAHAHHTDTVDLLISYGADVYVRNNFNQTMHDLLGDRYTKDDDYKENVSVTENDEASGWSWGSILLAGAAIIGGAMVVNAAMSEDQSRKISGDSDSENDGY